MLDQSPASTIDAYRRGAAKLAARRPQTAGPRGASLTPSQCSVARRYGASPVPEAYRYEHAELNRPSDTVYAAISPSVEPLPQAEARSRSRSPMSHGTSRCPSVQAGSVPRIPAPPTEGRIGADCRTPSFSRPRSAGLMRRGDSLPAVPSIASMAGDDDAMPPRSVSPAVGATVGYTPAPSPPLERPRSRDSHYVRPTLRDTCATPSMPRAPEDEYDLCVEDFLEDVAAARLAIDREREDWEPLGDEEVQRLQAQGVAAHHLPLEPPPPPPWLDFIVDCWDDIVQGEALGRLERRVARHCGVSPARAAIIVNELEAIAVGVCHGTLNLDRLEYATRSSCAPGVIAALRECCPHSAAWPAEADAWLDTALSLLSK